MIQKGIIYENILVNEINEILILPQFIQSQREFLTINNKQYRADFVIRFINHLVELHQYDVSEMQSDLVEICPKNDEHYRLSPLPHYCLHTSCFLNFASLLPGFELIDTVYNQSCRSQTILVRHPDYPVYKPSTFFIGEDDRIQISISLTPKPEIVYNISDPSTLIMHQIG